MSFLKPVRDSAQKWAQYVINKIHKPGRKLKVSESIFRKYMILGHIKGELTALERFLNVIRMNKELYNDALEAELHLSIKDYNNLLVHKLNLGKDINVDDILKEYNYYSKD